MNFILRSRAYISFLIWLVNVVLFNVLLLSIKRISNPGLLLLLILLAYGIQAVPFWYYLKKHFSEYRHGNIVIVATMPILIILGVWIGVIIIAFLTAIQIGT